MFGYMELSMGPFLCGCADFRTDAAALPKIADSFVSCNHHHQHKNSFPNQQPLFQHVFKPKYIYFSALKCINLCTKKFFFFFVTPDYYFFLR